MRLLTDEMLATLPPSSAEDYRPDALVACKLYGVVTGWRWYVVAGDQYDADGNDPRVSGKPVNDVRLYCWACGHADEFGTVSLGELEGIYTPLGPEVVRDLDWTPRPLAVTQQQERDARG